MIQLTRRRKRCQQLFHDMVAIFLIAVVLSLWKLREPIRHTRLKFSSMLLAISATWMFTSPATAEIIYESGSLGTTGIARADIVGGSNVSNAVFVGARFHVDQPIITTRIGGHFIKNIGANESFFGAVVALDDENDFPNSAALTSTDVIGTTLLTFPDTSSEVFGSLAKPLNPGWYALVFGSGHFGANGNGVAMNNGMNIGDPAYIAWQSGAVQGWGNLTNPIFRNFRFVVQGQVVPEPHVVILMLIVMVSGLLVRSPNR